MAGKRCCSTASGQADDGPGEYPDIYRTFADLIDERRSLVDVAPLRLVADCLLAGERRTVDPVASDGASPLERLRAVRVMKCDGRDPDH